MQPSELKSVGWQTREVIGDGVDMLFTASQMADALESAMDAQRSQTCRDYEGLGINDIDYSAWRDIIKELRLKE
jgi:hypothetical protein